MDEMRALRLDEWGGDLTVTREPIPTPAPAEVLIEVEATSVGLTVYNAVQGYLGDDSSTLPVVPGHEIVGRVVERGPGVTGLDPGQRVAAYFYLTCDRCIRCRSGDHNLCENHAGYVGIDVDGGFAEYLALPAGNAIAIPNELDPVSATVIPDAVATPYHVATQRANVRRGDEVVVLGAGGGVGIHMLQVARHFGADVTAVDRSEKKLQRCAELGAELTVHTDHEELADAVPHDEYDAVVDFTGSMELVEAASRLLGVRGRVVHLTAFPGRSMAVEPRTMVPGETSVLGSRYCSKTEFVGAAELVAEGHVDPVVTEVVDLPDVEALLEEIAAGGVIGRGAVTP